MQLSSFEIPLTIYSISKALNNTTFVINTGGGNIPIRLLDGNYDNMNNSSDNMNLPYIETIINEPTR